MHESRVNFCKRDKDELAFMKTRVGNLDLFGLDMFLVIKEEIKVDDTGTPSKGFLTSHA